MKKNKVSTTLDKTPIAIIGTDSHLKKDNYELVNSCFNQVIGLANDLNINTFFHGGDFFTSRNAQPEDVLQNAKRLFELFKNSGVSYWQIPGNHDKTKLDSEDSYLDIFDKYCNLIRTSDYVDVYNVRIHLIPYFKEDVNYVEYLEKAIDNIDLKKINILITHIAITGVKNNDGSEVKNNLTQKSFKTFDKVFIGHYHNRSQVGDNVYYMGSMYAGNYGEDNEKGVVILFSDGSHEYYQLDFPHYIKLTIDSVNRDELKKVEKQYKGTEHNVRIIFKGDESNLKTIDKASLEEKGFSVKFESKEVIQDISIIHDELVTFNRSNLKEAFDTFCKKNNFDNIEQGKKYLEKI